MIPNLGLKTGRVLSGESRSPTTMWPHCDGQGPDATCKFVPIREACKWTAL